ncbi:acyl-CoA dehydrogenase family protein [Thermomonospora curvata]|uniref:Acyl-CoA dehydrogenase type 2 domain protein n=1 Tax=Thermomonospora curvata (strain ATCC 19995 / DSM 43183 / JCM 3096 / KCTC 9072 / NBRC 15933 / NCIMB 10081 / Henssen B9) TaxID=471852 RepID=D1AA36_THECD|nr:acyl-CoA dehydrogenase family protein [Thermomonospora curvata]ACY96972.1 Acyl-CoA dehydrogenase type 2 domain protein [Thermomonospora curvata DSM 43183]
MTADIETAARPVTERADFADVVAAIAARAAEHDRDASFPHEAFTELHRVGVLNLTVPAELGGGGATLAETVEVIRAVGAADPSVALVLAMHLIAHAGLGRPDNPWPKEVRRRVQRSSLAGVALINALRVEPELGTPARGGLPATVAERTDDGWVLRGHKIYSTGAPGLRWMLVWARTGDPEPLVGAFLVPAGVPGYRIEPTWDHLGMRATRSDDVIFEGVRIPAEYAVDVQPAARARPDARVTAWNTLLISAIYDGVARAARDWLVGYLNERTPANLGRPLATLPRFQTAVGRIEALLLANDTLLQSAARQADAGGAPDVGLVKHLVTGNAVQAVELGIGLIGNPGLSRRNPIERHYRNVLCSRIHTPQDDTVLIAAGTAALAG